MTSLVINGFKEPDSKGPFRGGMEPAPSPSCLAIKGESGGGMCISLHLLFLSVLHPPLCRGGAVAALLLRRRLDFLLARESRRSRRSQATKAEVLDGAAVGEVVEAEEDMEVGHLQHRRLLPLRQAVMSET